MNAPPSPTVERRHAFRVPRAAWERSLRLRFDLSFAPRERRRRWAPTGPAEAAARRLRWSAEGDAMVTSTAKGGTAVKHLRLVARRWAFEDDARDAGVDLDAPVAIEETDDVRCRRCGCWTDAECSICCHCGGLA